VSEYPWLTTLGVLPLVGALVVAVIPRGRELLAKQIALGVSLLVVALTVAMALQFNEDSEATFQFVENLVWIERFGIN